MVHRVSHLCVLVLVALALPAAGLTPGTDILVAAAARGAGANESLWVTDLCLFNPGSQTATGTVAWLVRNAANSSPQTFTFTLLAGETLCIDDVIFNRFALSAAAGAFRVQADQPVVATSRIYKLKSGVTFGQGFEGVLRSAAVAAGASADVVGLTDNASFRSNVILIDASDNGSTVALSLRDADGSELARRTYTLKAFEPKLFAVSDLGAGSFDVGTLHATVVSGAAIVTASKIDNDSATGDPTTLAPATAGTNLGSYQIALYDSLNYASGGTMMVASGEKVAIAGTYNNYDKVDGGENPVCTLIFSWGENLPASTTLDDLAQGVTFTDAYTDSGQLTFGVTLTISNGLTVSGTVDAVGVGFESDPDPLKDESGCNGTFPTLTLKGGKSSS